MLEPGLTQRRADRPGADDRNGHKCLLVPGRELNLRFAPRLAPLQLIELHSVPCQPQPDCRISNWRGSVRTYRSEFTTCHPLARASDFRLGPSASEAIGGGRRSISAATSKSGSWRVVRYLALLRARCLSRRAART